MTKKFTFGEHASCVTLMQHTMSVLKEAGAKVTVETELATSKNFVLHTVVAEMPKKEHPVQFTKAGHK